MMAAKYRRAVIKVNTVLSVACKECIFCIKHWILGEKIRTTYVFAEVGIDGITDLSFTFTKSDSKIKASEKCTR